MEELTLFASALSLAAMAGVNLYLTTLVLGLAVRYDWITLYEGMEGLEVAGHPAVIVVAGVLYLIEFIADKVPWVDSLWDSVHTAIRPVGGAILGLTAVGSGDPVDMIVVGLLSGGVALTAHATKASTRILANTSPEPLSNPVLSVVEDVIVVCGLIFAYLSPLGMLIAITISVLCFFYFGPEILRFTVVTLRFAFFRLTSIGSVSNRRVSLPKQLPEKQRRFLEKEFQEGDYIVWAVEVFSGQMKGFPLNRRSWLCHVLPSNRLVLVTKKGKLRCLSVSSVTMEVSEYLLFDAISFREAGDDGKNKGIRVRFAKHMKTYFISIQSELRKYLGKSQMGPEEQLVEAERH